jgi:hypothetical protein
VPLLANGLPLERIPFHQALVPLFMVLLILGRQKIKSMTCHGPVSWFMHKF